MPGTDLKRSLQSNPRKRAAPSDKVTRDAAVSFGNRSRDDARVSIDDIVDKFSATVRNSILFQQPLKWMRTASSRATDTGGAFHYLSLFDGENGSINSVAKSFNLRGLPPADLKGKCPIDL